MQKKILITGAGSYIGMAVEEYLSKHPEQYSVTTIETKGLKPIPEMFCTYDVVFHVAGIAHIKEKEENKHLYFAINRDLTLEVAKAAKAGGVKHFIVLSSMNVYGKTVGHITKQTIPKPVSAYGLSKYEADEVLIRENSNEFNVTILRPPMVYGKDCKGNYQFLRKFVTRFHVFPNFKNERSLIYIGNLCEFVKNVIDTERTGVFFPQNAEYVCTSDMVRKIAKYNRKTVIQTSLFNWLIKVLPIGILDKVFGDLTYEKVDLVDKYSFEESIKLSEENCNENKCKTKDVLFLCQFFYPEYVSSATLPYDTARRLVKAGFKVGALCGYPKEYSGMSDVPLKENVGGIEIKRLKYLQLKRSNFLGRIINYFSFVVAVFFNLSHCKEYKTIVVYSNPPILPLLATWIKKRYQSKFIFVTYDIYPELAINTNSIETSGIIARIMRYVNKRVYESADSVVALSNDMKDFILLNRNISEEKVVVIPNWYEDLSEQYANPMLSHPFAEKYDGKFVVSYLGNMGICQDMDTIMDAVCKMKDVEDIQFLFAGHGNKVSEIKDIIYKQELKNIDLYDFLEGDDYHAALSISDCSIVSLSKDTVGLCSPSKVYGYMMAGNAIIAIMDECELEQEIEKHQMGYHVKNGNADKLVDVIMKLKNQPATLETMKQKSVDVFKEKYTKEICTAQYVELLSKMY